MRVVGHAIWIDRGLLCLVAAHPAAPCGGITVRGLRGDGSGVRRSGRASRRTHRHGCLRARLFGRSPRGSVLTNSGQAKRPQRLRVEVVLDPGPDLFSQGPTSQVSSALVGLTAVFGMGTGVTPPLQGPRRQLYQATRVVGKAAPMRRACRLADGLAPMRRCRGLNKQDGRRITPAAVVRTMV